MIVRWEIYTDGACEGNQYSNNLGGWAFLVVKDELVIHKDSGSARNTTNNRMEMFAVIRAFDYVLSKITLGKISVTNIKK